MTCWKRRKGRATRQQQRRQARRTGEREGVRGGHDRGRAARLGSERRTERQGCDCNCGGGFPEAGAAKVRETIEDFNASVPVLREMGYTLSDVAIPLGLPPNVHATFQVSHEVSDEAVARALEQNAERKLTTFLIQALTQARRLQTSIAIAGMKPRGITVGYPTLAGRHD